MIKARIMTGSRPRGILPEVVLRAVHPSAAVQGAVRLFRRVPRGGLPVSLQVLGTLQKPFLTKCATRSQSVVRSIREDLAVFFRTARRRNPISFSRLVLVKFAAWRIVACLPSQFETEGAHARPWRGL